MNLLCYNHLHHAEVITGDQEDLLVDYLESFGIEADIDMSTVDICHMVLAVEPYTPSVYTDTITSEIPQYGILNIDLYMKIAMDADRDTLNAMIRTSKAHNTKFDEAFFKKYLQHRYPLTLTFKPYGISYHDYYLKLVYAIHKLYEDYDFPYFPSPSLDPVSVFIQVDAIKKTTLPKWHQDKYLANIGLINAATIGDTKLIQHFIDTEATRIDDAIKSTDALPMIPKLRTF